MKVISLTYKSTNCYLIEAESGWLMIDAGWPDTLPQLLHLLKQKDIHVSDIKYLVVTHFHPDHAGLVQNLKELKIKLILHEGQVPFVDELNIFFRENPKANFKNIVSGDNIVVTGSESRNLLRSIGINGEILKTPGHSDDSVSIIIDGCCAFTGDLPALSLIEAYGSQALKDSWALVKGFNVREIYPAHGKPYIL